MCTRRQTGHVWYVVMVYFVQLSPGGIPSLRSNFMIPYDLGVD